MRTSVAARTCATRTTADAFSARHDVRKRLNDECDGGYTAAMLTSLYTRSTNADAPRAFAPEVCYQAMKAHDARFDGRFFVGVSSTKIYCRPICRVKLPLFKNCSFHPSAAAAESAGFRPCLKCRPELAPGFAASEASTTLARTAARLIEDAVAGVGKFDDDVAAISERVGVTDRHLRRIFQTEFGVSPVQYAQTQRLLLAKRLLTDTTLPVADVAFASGFSSVRRMNALFAERYGFAPTRLRKEADVAPQNARFFTFNLSYRPPYDWDWMLSFFEKRAIPGVETVVDGAYRRILRVERDGETPITCWLQVKHAAEKHSLEVMLSPAFAPVIATVLAYVKRVFDLHCDPTEISIALGKLAKKSPGLRLPGAFDGFELAVRAVLGQQVTVKAARTLATRFVAAHGESMQFDIAPPFDDLHFAFPTAWKVATLTQDDIAKLGIVSARANAIIAIAQKVASGELDVSSSASLETTSEVLQSIKGIGPWTAHYIAMRALSWPDAFPPQDVAILNALELPNTAKGQREADALAEAWRPWRSYAVMHLWKSLETTH
jgi:AraC family transcriptional regulator, regulatory protein of adaptative response / DNA-3-methyladenine glycosylase II